MPRSLLCLAAALVLTGVGFIASPSADAQTGGVILRERVEIAAPASVPVSSASATCGGPLDPPCPPDPTPCEFPDATDCVETDDGFSGVVVTAPGRLSFWVQKLATRGDLGDPAYLRLDTLDVVGQLEIEVRGADGVRRVETLDARAGLTLSWENATENPDDGSPDWTRRYDQAEGGAPRFETGLLAPGDTVSLVYAMRVPGNRVPRYDFFGPTGGTPTHLFWSGDPEVMTLYVFEPGPGGTVANFLDTPYPAPYVQVFGRFERADGFTVTPDTLFAGDAAALALASALPPETAVTLSVEDPAAGGLVSGMDPPAARGSAPARGGRARSGQASLTTTLGAVGDVQFVAADDLDAVTFTTVTAAFGGESVTADVAVYPQPVVRVIRQNTDPVPASGPDAYLMVSKVRPDWLLPGSGQSFRGTWGGGPFRNTGEGRPNPSLEYDPDTYRIEVRGLPPSIPDRRVELRLDLQGEPIWETGREGGPTLPFAAYEAVCNTIGTEKTCRSERSIRLVSNARPARGAYAVFGGGYDDEVAGTQTIRVGLGSQVRVAGYLTADGSVAERELAPGGVTLPVGQSAAPSGAPRSDDTVRQALLQWHTYQKASGQTLASEPDLITARMSEDWAQASILFRQAAPPRIVSATSPRNMLVVTVPDPAALAQMQSGGTVSGVIGQGGVRQSFSVQVGAGGPSTAAAISNAITGALLNTPINPPDAFSLDGRGATSFALVFSGAAVLDFTDVPGLVNLVRFNESLELESVGPLDRNEAVQALARAVQTPGQSATVAGQNVAVINVVVAPLPAIRSAANSTSLLAFATDDKERARPNTLILNENAANERDGQGTVAGHEIGHVLLVGAFSGSDTDCGRGGRQSHVTTSYNVMNCDVSGVPGPLPNPENVGREGVDAGKRLTEGQQASARCESGVGSSTSLCLSGEPSAPNALPILSPLGAPQLAPRQEPSAASAARRPAPASRPSRLR